MANEITKVTDKNNVDHPLRDEAAQTALTGILNGQSIDSFGDVESALADKVDKVSGKGLSTNDYDNTEKGKVAGAFPRSEQNILCARQLLPYPYVDGTYKEKNGGTFTVSDGGKITVDGNFSGNSAFYLGSNYIQSYVDMINEYKGKNISLILDGDFTSDKVDLQIWSSSLYINNNTPFVIPSNFDTTNFNICVIVKEAANIDHLLVSPLLRLASDPSNKFSSYAMTNKELTEEVIDQIFEPQHNPNYDSSLSFRIGDNDSHVVVHKIGKIVVINIHDLVANEAVTLTAWVPLLINLPARAKQMGTGIDYFHGVLYKNRNEVIPIQIDARQINGVSYGTTLQPSSNVSLNANDKLFGTIVYVCQ